MVTAAAGVVLQPGAAGAMCTARVRVSPGDRNIFTRDFVSICVVLPTSAFGRCTDVLWSTACCPCMCAFLIRIRVNRGGAEGQGRSGPAAGTSVEATGPSCGDLVVSASFGSLRW